MTRLTSKNAPFLDWAETRAVMTALEADNGKARFVGGAVRNALMGFAVSDIDIATQFTPQEAVARLSAAKIRTVPTGIEHGTVTAVMKGKPFEVTTLRCDVSTDGRRATVAFSTDWEEDAKRRDFTINALYASLDGDVFDYVGGVADLKAHRVRFVGDPSTRVAEDYLRILRLFRFHAWYGKGAVDAEALSACASAKQMLARLSAERVQKELLKLLGARQPADVLEVMELSGILEAVLPGPFNVARVRHLCEIAPEPDALLRLAALLSGNGDKAASVAARLRLSNKDAERLAGLLAPGAALAPDLALRDLRKALYHEGPARIHDRILLAWAQDDQRDWRELLNKAATASPPPFPLSGHDVVALGVEQGARVGRILSAVESWWIDADFKPGRAALQARLKEEVANRA